MTTKEDPQEDVKHLLDASIQMLEGEPSGMTPQTGKGVIDGWLEQLRHAPDATSLTNLLEGLKNQLAGGQPNPHELAELMRQMAEQTQLVDVDNAFSAQLSQLRTALARAADTFDGKQLD